MNDVKSTVKIWALALGTLTVFSGCAALPSGGADTARIDAAVTHVGPCAGALAGDDMPEAREACLPLVVIVDGAR